MFVVTSARELKLKDTIVCIGNFDGVHLGHQMLLRHMQEEARLKQKASVIVSFFPPSRHYFSSSPYLSSRTEKLELFKIFEPHGVVLIHFDEVYTKTPKESFLADIAYLQPDTLIVGENFRFGHERKGSLYDLSHYAKKLEVFNLKHGEGKAISSSRIRDLLSQGDVAEARLLLGRPYSASGKVIKGDERGRSIGFPTANIHIDKDKALPLGVFAVRVKTPLGDYAGMANVGPRPSFPNEPPALEVHIFDFDADIYDQELTLFFISLLRQQRKFLSLEDLKAQLTRDKDMAINALHTDPLISGEDPVLLREP